MKRSTQVSLVLVAAAGIGGAAAAMMPDRCLTPLRALSPAMSSKTAVPAVHRVRMAALYFGSGTGSSKAGTSTASASGSEGAARGGFGSIGHAFASLGG